MNLMLVVSLLLAAAPSAVAPVSAPTHGSKAEVDTTQSLAATTAPPWNPASPVSSRRAWEQVVLFPGRVASLPLFGLGRLADQALAYGEQRGFVPTGPAVRPTLGARNVKISTPHLGGRVGYGASLEVRQRLFSGPLENELSVRYAQTTRQYNGAFVSFTGKPLSLQYGNTWRPQEHFYGVGAQTPDDLLTNYAARREYLRLEAISEALATEAYPARTRVNAFVETRSQVTRIGHEPGLPSFEAYSPQIADAILDRQTEHLIYGLSLLNDSRAGDQHWSRGSRLLLAAERHDAPVHALALRVGSGGGAQFNRYLLESETGFSYGRIPRTLRLLGRIVDQHITAGADRMLIADLSTLGGTVGLAGFHQGRFHDMDLMLLKSSYIFPIARRLELDLHSEWGSVYGDVWHDAKLTTFHHSYGVSLRGCYVTGPVAALGVDLSHESVRISYTLGRVE